MTLFKRKPKKYKIVEFYNAEYDRVMYYIMEKFLFFWVDVNSSFYYDVHKPKKHELMGLTIIYYEKDDAVDIIRENIKLMERINRKDNPKTKTTEVSEDDFKEKS